MSARSQSLTSLKASCLISLLTKVLVHLSVPTEDQAESLSGRDTVCTYISAPTLYCTYTRTYVHTVYFNHVSVSVHPSVCVCVCATFVTDCV